MDVAIKCDDRDKVLELLDDEFLNHSDVIDAVKYGCKRRDGKILCKAIPIEEEWADEATKYYIGHHARLIEQYSNVIPTIKWFKLLVEFGADVNSITFSGKPLFDTRMDELERMRERQENLSPNHPAAQCYADRVRDLTEIITILIACPRVHISEERRQKIVNVGLESCLENRADL